MKTRSVKLVGLVEERLKILLWRHVSWRIALCMLYVIYMRDTLYLGMHDDSFQWALLCRVGSVLLLVLWIKAMLHIAQPQAGRVRTRSQKGTRPSRVCFSIHYEWGHRVDSTPVVFIIQRVWIPCILPSAMHWLSSAHYSARMTAKSKSSARHIKNDK